jgi:hypothetical protein
MDRLWIRVLAAGLFLAAVALVIALFNEPPRFTSVPDCASGYIAKGIECVPAGHGAPFGQLSGR